MISIFGNVIVPLKKRIMNIYLADGREAVYAAYRNIMWIVGQDSKQAIQESHRVVRPWIAEWDKE
jgi:hypothetical protein